MNRKLIVLNVLLGAILVWLGVQLRAHWLESQQREQAALARQAKAVPVTPPASIAPVEPTTAAAYIEVAQKMLFAKDRDPNVIIEAAPPPPPPPEPPVPPLPRYHGQMAFGEPVLVLSTEKTPQKSYRKGDKVGEFTIAEFDHDSVTFTWNGKTLVNTLKSLVPKEAEKPVQQAAAPAAKSATAAPAPRPKANLPQPTGDAMLGKPNGPYRTCVDGDQSPAGTVVSGFKKAMVVGLFGTTCQWEPIR